MTLARTDDSMTLEQLEAFVERYSTSTAIAVQEDPPAVSTEDLVALLLQAIQQSEQQPATKREAEDDEDPAIETHQHKRQRTCCAAAKAPDGRIDSSTAFLLPPLMSDMGIDMLTRVLVPDLLQLPQLEVHSDPQNHVHGTSLEVIASSWDGFWETGQIHLDNTLAIREVLSSTNDQLLVWTAPSGSGKSVFLSLLRNFSAAVAPMDRKERQGRFKPYAICEKAPRYFKKHFAQHPVLLLDVSRGKPRSVQGAMSIVASAIVDAAKQYMKVFSSELTCEQRYQIHSGITEEFMTAAHADLEQLRAEFNILESGEVSDTSLFVTFIDRLVHLLARCFGGKKIVVLIDGFDTPFAHVFSSCMALDEQNAILSVYERLYQRLMAQDEVIGTRIIAGIHDVSKRFCVADRRQASDLFVNATGLSIDSAEHIISRFVDEDWSKGNVSGACPTDKVKSDLMWVCHHRFGNQAGDVKDERISNIYCFLRLLQGVRKEPAIMPANLVRLDYFMWPEHTDELSFIVSRNITDKRLFDRFAKLVLGAYLSRDFHIKQALASGTYKTIQEAIAHQNSCTRTTPVATWSTEFRDMAAKLVSSSVDLPRHRYQVSTLEMLGILLSDGSLVPRARHAVRICTPDAFLRMLVLLNCGQYGFATASSYMEWYAEYVGITSNSAFTFGAAIADSAYYLAPYGKNPMPKFPISLVQCLTHPLYLAGIKMLVTREPSGNNRGTFCFTLKGAARSSTFVVMQAAHPSQKKHMARYVENQLRAAKSPAQRQKNLMHISNEYLQASVHAMPRYPDQAPIPGDRLLCIGLAFYEKLLGISLREYEWKVGPSTPSPDGGQWTHCAISYDMCRCLDSISTRAQWNVAHGNVCIGCHIE